MKLSKNTKQIIFSFFFVIIFTVSFYFVAVSPLSPFIDGTTITDKTIRYDWLNVQIYDDPNDLIKFTKGGLKLTEFENDGIFSTSDLTNEIVFKSRATFEFEMNAYTDIDLFDVWPNINVDAEARFQYLWMVLYNPWPFLQGSYHYYVSCRQIDFGEVFNPCDYDVSLPITIDIAPDFSDLSGEVINGIQINSADYVYQVKAVEVSEVRDGECGGYEDQYTDQGYQEATVDLTQFAEDAVTNGNALSLIASANLGAIPGETRTYDIQNSKLDTFPVGFTEINPASGAYIFNDYLAMRPKITKTVQEFQVRYVGFETCAFWGTSTVYGAVSQSDQDRVRSAHVYNQFIHKEYKVSVNFLATVQLDYQTYESFLSDPYLKMGDWLWDEEIGGTTEVIPVYNQPGFSQLWDATIGQLFAPGGLVSWIIAIIVILVALYIFIKLGVPYISRRMKKKEIEQANLRRR